MSMKAFDKLIDIFTRAKRAEFALIWFDEMKTIDSHIKLINIAARVDYASATDVGVAANDYVVRAAMSPDVKAVIMKIAEAMAREDLKAGKELLVDER